MCIFFYVYNKCHRLGRWSNFAGITMNYYGCLFLTRKVVIVYNCSFCRLVCNYRLLSWWENCQTVTQYTIQRTQLFPLPSIKIKIYQGKAVSLNDYNSLYVLNINSVTSAYTVHCKNRNEIFTVEMKCNLKNN